MPNLVADARALSPGQYVHLVIYGSTAVADGGGGLYIWNAAATNADDGGSWLKPDSLGGGDPGRWQRVWLTSLAATTLLAGLVMLGAHNETTAGEAVQCSDPRLHPAVGLAGTPAYITIDGATQVITRALIDLANHVTGTLTIGNGGTGQTTAAAAFAALKQNATESATGVVELATSAETTAGLVIQASDTRIHDAVTLAGSPEYLTLSGQQITRVLIDLANHVTGLLPLANLASLATVTEAGTSRTNTAADRGNFVRWTNTGAKTFTVANSIASDGHTWSGRNAAATGNLTFAQGAGVTLSGDLIFAPGKTYTIRFTAASAADVIGGSAS